MIIRRNGSVQLYSLAEVNKMEQLEFIEKIGWVFEDTPWVAEKAFSSKPFASLKNLYQTMVNKVEEADEKAQLALINAHPDLGSRIKMTESSVKEQKGAGLDSLTEEEFASFSLLNKQYLEKFGFPFILAVKGHTKETIYQAMEQRVDHQKEQEFQTALLEIYKIVGFRLEELVKEK
ncbi:2-oxo-4-hydroxy-4-carboxy-5-ureidoimidazoline decarboxylase [Niallia nealsonii]|nr:2-oxo-4-hydroxy-4-carboxy-5-ureidoimidazoline decarboxylase [Niallia nealsonii]